MKDEYFKLINSIVRARSALLSMIDAQLNKFGILDLKNIQVLILCSLGEQECTVGDLTKYGHYHGTNVAYNLRKLIEDEYMEMIFSPSDKRISIVRLTEKGRAICDKFTETWEKHKKLYCKKANLSKINEVVSDLCEFWEMLGR